MFNLFCSDLLTLELCFWAKKFQFSFYSSLVFVTITKLRVIIDDLSETQTDYFKKINKESYKYKQTVKRESKKSAIHKKMVKIFNSYVYVTQRVLVGTLVNVYMFSLSKQGEFFHPILLKRTPSYYRFIHKNKFSLARLNAFVQRSYLALAYFVTHVRLLNIFIWNNSLKLLKLFVKPGAPAKPIASLTFSIRWELTWTFIKLKSRIYRRIYPLFSRLIMIFNFRLGTFSPLHYYFYIIYLCKLPSTLIYKL